MEVVAAVIERVVVDGDTSSTEILIGQRKPVGRHALKWEFPGGKVEPGEEPRAALARELREELNIQAIIGEEVERYDFSYSPGRLTKLIFYRVTEFTGEPANLDFSQILWTRRERLPEFDFLEGDVAFVKRLAQSH